ncbi:amino acid adenylation domain-containing protein [Micromonospora sp. NPDC093244]|uniref:amino acid adenylation domain-containing protein n=1 Tax=Micromonospora sp. NPDC093244 TaxID=3155071 RepID=UPI003445E1B1
MSAPSSSQPLIHEAVAAHATRDPDAPALIWQDRAISYRTLDTAANTYAADLADSGVGPGQVVPILLDRSPEMVALQLAVLKTGAAYTNLDPSWPAERQKLILDLISPAVTVTTDDRWDGRFDRYQPSGGGIDDAAWRARAYDPVSVPPDSPATVFFTSGTTGVPKGVLSPHQAVTRLFGPEGLDGFGPGHATPQFAALPWDMYAFELWGQLTTGGTVVLVAESHLLPNTLRHVVSRHGVDTLWITTSVFNLFVDVAPGCFDGLAHVYTGGEKASPEHVRGFLTHHPDLPLWNAYGPAESCMITTLRRLVPADCDVPGGVPVGTPVRGTGVVLLDERGTRCGPGREGEICIVGQGLANGYLAQPELTREKFPTVDIDGVPDRIYRTGDMGVWDDDGVLHYRGRRDRQVKINGQRIELAEIESVAGSLPDVRNCVAFAVTNSDGVPVRLALVYQVPRSEADPSAPSDDPLRVHDQLRRLLPAYLVPQTIRGLTQYPVTANGKVDRAALHEIARISRPATRVRAGRNDER